MGEIMSVSNNWATRPADERFTSLAALQAFLDHRDSLTLEAVRPLAKLQVQPLNEQMVDAAAGGSLTVRSAESDGRFGGRAFFSHWSFGQLASIAGAPAGYLRRLPAPLAALCLNSDLAQRGAYAFGESGNSKMLVRGENGRPSQVTCFTSETYGRIKDSAVCREVIAALNDLDSGGCWGIPGTFGGNSGKQYTPYTGTAADTTLYAGDHDSFIFQADESRLIEQPGTGDYGQGGPAPTTYPVEYTGGNTNRYLWGNPPAPVATRPAARPMSRGFIVSNSEVGARTLRVQLFTFDYVCANRIIWDASVVGSLAIRHTSGAPARFIHEAVPAIRAFINGSDAPMLERISRAQATVIGGGKVDDSQAPATLTAWLRSMGVTSTVAAGATTLAGLESGRTDTVWAAVQGLTAYARGVEYADERTELESLAGGLMSDRALVSAGRFERSTRGQRGAVGVAA